MPGSQPTGHNTSRYRVYPRVDMHSTAQCRGSRVHCSPRAWGSQTSRDSGMQHGRGAQPRFSRASAHMAAASIIWQQRALQRFGRSPRPASPMQSHSACSQPLEQHACTHTQHISWCACSSGSWDTAGPQLACLGTQPRAGAHGGPMHVERMLHAHGLELSRCSSSMGGTSGKVKGWFSTGKWVETPRARSRGPRAELGRRSP